MNTSFIAHWTLRLGMISIGMMGMQCGSGGMPSSAHSAETSAKVAPSCDGPIRTLRTGSMPYRNYFGENPSCDGRGCSKIKVITPASSGVLVTIKRSRDGQVVAHAYIEPSDHFTLEVPNGTYDVYFIYGTRWCTTRIVKNSRGKLLRGGFADQKTVGKDERVSLYHNILTYELILQTRGNFSPAPASLMEAL